MTTNLASEQAFKAHIHRLLDEHVAVHLTTSYVDCTQLHVYEILTAGLVPVSEEDPRSLVLPSDPLDDLIREHCQIEPKAVCERLPALEGSKELIYSIMKTTPSNRIFTSKFPDTFCSYSPKSDLFVDPPVLTLRSIQHTPKAGGIKIPHFVPLKLTEVLSQISKEIALEDFDDAADTQNEDVLPARLVVDDHNLKEILLSYKANPFSTTPPSGAESAPCHKSLYRMPSPPLLLSLPQTPPLFSRINAAPKLPAAAPGLMLDISVVPTISVSLNDDGDDGTLEYEVVRDEWAMSSSSTPSPDGIASDQDDIFAPSSEPLGPIDDLLAANMDTFYIPRQLRVGKSRGALRVPGEAQLLYEYIGDVVNVNWTREPNTTTKLSAASDTTFTSPTLVHCVGAFPRPKNTCPSSDDMEDGILGRLTQHLAGKAIDTVLFDQPKDTSHCLMDVPQLPLPNVHTRTALWPNDMSSLINHEDFAAFYVAKGVKSLILELTWRPYNSERAIPTHEELLGVSDFDYFFANSYADGEGAKTQLADLRKQLDPLTRPISAEEENQRELRTVLKSPKPLSFNTDELRTLNCGSNVLLTRAERHKSWLPSRTHLEGDCDNGTKWGRGSCTAQPQSPERMTIDSPSEDEYHLPSTDRVQLCPMDSGPLVYGYPPLSDPSEDVVLDAEVGIVSASHVHMPVESVVSVSTADLYREFAFIRIPETSDSSRRSWIRPSETGSLEANYVSASSGLATCEEQSLHGYLHVLANQPLLARADNDIHFTSPASSEVQRLSNPPVDTEVQLRELSKLAAPLPSLGVSPHHNHRYLASVELLQDRLLMRALHVDSLRIELLEREWLDGADIVFDCDTALVFVPMSQALLPSGFRSFKDRLSSLSWRYTRLGVVFQLYDCGVSGPQRPQSEEEQANSFARVINFIRQLHRELALAEEFGTKQPQTVVRMYSVRTNEEAATAARLLGDMAESRSQFAPWGDRLWLAEDQKEDERNLTAVDGMNAFAAAAILSYIPLQDFLALRADQRLQLALPIPEGTINRFNEVIAERREHVDTIVGDDNSSP